MNKLIVLLMVLVLSRSVWGVNAIQVTDVGSSAQTIGIGNIEGFNQTAASVLENPASLMQIERQSVSFFTTRFMDDVAYRSFAYAKNTKYGVFGIGLMSASVDDIPYTKQNSSGQFEVDHYFGYQNSIYKLGYAYPLRKDMAFGIGVNYLSSGAAGVIEGKGYNMDFGFVTYGKDLDTSFTLRNAVTISRVDYTNGEKEDFPIEMILGAKYHPSSWYSLYGQLRRYDIQNRLLASGAVAFYPGSVKYLTLSLGFKNTQDTIGSLKTSTTFGVGLKMKGVFYNYSYETSEYYLSDGKHYFSIGVNF